MSHKKLISDLWYEADEAISKRAGVRSELASIKQRRAFFEAQFGDPLARVEPLAREKAQTVPILIYQGHQGVEDYVYVTCGLSDRVCPFEVCVRSSLFVRDYLFRIHSPPVVLLSYIRELCVQGMKVFPYMLLSLPDSLKEQVPGIRPERSTALLAPTRYRIGQLGKPITKEILLLDFELIYDSEVEYMKIHGGPGLVKQFIEMEVQPHLEAFRASSV